MALVHENLYQAGDFSKIAMANHIQNLCAHLCNAHGPVSQRTEFAIQISDLYLNINQAITCSLLVNELVSNALKHAFPDQRPGHVRVELRPLGGHRLVLAVSDDGVGLPLDLDLARVDTLGLQLVQDLTNQLHGTVEMSRRPGTTFTVTFDAADSGGIEA
jgi:two-component sensor histidine kinase